MGAKKDANRDAEDTKQAALLLAGAMDQFEALFIETTRAALGRTPPIAHDDWFARKEAAHANRQRAAEIVDRMEARLPPSTIESPKFRRSSVYLFYFTSRIGLARQFSAVDIMHLANKLMFAANEEDDGELAAATAQCASELGQYALFLLQAAPTLTNDRASIEKMKVLVSSVDVAYEEAKTCHGRAVTAFERLNM